MHYASFYPCRYFPITYFAIIRLQSERNSSILKKQELCNRTHWFNMHNTIACWGQRSVERPCGTPWSEKTWCDGSVRYQNYLWNRGATITPPLSVCEIERASEGERLRERMVGLWKTLFCKNVYNSPLAGALFSALPGLRWHSSLAACSHARAVWDFMASTTPGRRQVRATLIWDREAAAAQRGPGGGQEGEACRQTHTLSRTNHHPSPAVPANGKKILPQSPLLLWDLSACVH